jgi:hypothetical protein
MLFLPTAQVLPNVESVGQRVRPFQTDCRSGKKRAAPSALPVAVTPSHIWK